MLQQLAELPVCNTTVRIERDYPAKECQCFLRAAPLMAEHREPLDRIHVVRVLVQDRTVERLRVGQTPDTIMLCRC